MEINIKMMSEVAYITLQKNPEDVYNQILKHPKDCSWLKEYLRVDPFEEKQYRIQNFELLSNEDSDETMLENSISIYEHLKHLPRYILCDPKFWAWITFEKAYSIAQKISKITGASFISSTWLITGARRSLMLGIISRLFFMVQMSVDESREDKYELTRYLLTNTETYRDFCYRNVGMLKNVTLAVLRAQKDISEKASLTLTSKQSAAMVKETSKIGSVMLIDIMTEDEIYELIYPKFVKILTNEIQA